MEVQSSNRRWVSWSDLPPEIVQLIPDFLSKVDDVRSFRAVCKQWRQSTFNISASLPRQIKTSVPRKLFSSYISLLRPPDAPQFPPWMVLVAESTKGVLQYFNPLSRTPLPNLPQNLDLTQLQSTVLATEHHVAAIDNGYNLFFSTSPSYAKVLMFFNQHAPFFRHCILLTLGVGGQVYKSWPFHLKGVNSLCTVGCRKTTAIDDVIRYKGKTFALGLQGILYSYAKLHKKCLDDCRRIEFHVCENLVNSMIPQGNRRQRLVVMRSSSGDEKLFLVVPLKWKGKGGLTPKFGIELQFKVYKLKDDCRSSKSSWVWTEVVNFAEYGDGQVLFITRDYCFFVVAAEFPGCQLRNCIVFSDDAFPLYSPRCKIHCDPEFGWNFEPHWNYGGKVGNEVAVFSLEGQAHYSLPVECFPGFPLGLWSPPPWVLRNSSSFLRSQSQSQREPKEDEMTQSDSNSEDIGSLQADKMTQSDSNSNDSGSFQEDVSASSASSRSECEERTSDNPYINAAREKTTCLENELEHVEEEALETENLKNAIVQTQTNSKAHLVQPSIKKILTLKFQGFDVEANHVPVLERVWIKHGDVIEGSVIRSCDTKTMALASLAKMVLILQTNSGNTLTDDQARYLDSTLSDLQHMRLKLDWLAPFVGKALETNKTKKLEVALVELKKAKAQAEGMEVREQKKLRSEITEVKQALNASIKLLSESIPTSGSIDLDKCLAEGIF